VSMIIPVMIGVLVLLLYMLKMGLYRHYWNKYPEPDTSVQGTSTGISVVVAFRDEEDAMPALLNSLLAQQYPAALWEVILVDDHSADRSAQFARDLAARDARFTYIRNGPGETGKKAAVNKGLQLASHEIVVTTDADCRMGPLWLSAIAGMYETQPVDMVIGLVDILEKPGLFNSFQEVEFRGLVASGAAAAAGGRPIYCNAANLSFRRELYVAQADPMIRSIASGDDTLFMLYVKQHFKRRIALLKSRSALVYTRGATGLRQFFDQRSRWASKSRYYTDRDILYTAGVVLALSVTMIFSLILLLTGHYAWLFPGMLAAKSATDYVFLRNFMRIYDKKPPVIPLVLFEAVYPLYIVISAAMGLFSRYTWKGRTYAREEKKISFPVRR
jgi:poly-beta-1,6-N-acetyl-D-glucosamine synthase